MADTMLALRKTTAEPGLQLEEVPVPEPAADEVLVEVETASICGTDLHIYGWDEWSQGRIVPPLTLGHEFAGAVVETGSLVRDLAPGDFVSAESHITCGVCFQCRTGHAHMCERTRILGVDRDGAFARYVAIPASVIWRNDRTKLPPEIATLQEPFGNAVFATSEQDLAGRAVAVLGWGPIGRPSGSGSPSRWAPPRSSTSTRPRTPPPGSSSTTRATASTSSSRCPARPGRSPMRSGSR